MGIRVRDWRTAGNHILLCLQRNGGWSMGSISVLDWAAETILELRKHTDRPIVVRQRAANRIDRIARDPLSKVLVNDVHALVTFNSNAATESVMLGVPVFTLAPANAAAPVGNSDLSQIESPYWADADKLHAWACHLAYGQFHVSELKDGTAYRILNAR
jgi:hypothetical protein